MNEVTFLAWSIIVLAIGWGLGRWQIHSRLTKGVDFGQVQQKGISAFTGKIRIVYRNGRLKSIKLAHGSTQKEEPK